MNKEEEILKEAFEEMSQAGLTTWSKAEDWESFKTSIAYKIALRAVEIASEDQTETINELRAQLEFGCIWVRGKMG